MKKFDRSRLEMKSFRDRESKIDLSVMIDPSSEFVIEDERIDLLAERMKDARDSDSPIVFAFGAHLIRNGLGPVMIEMMKRGYVDHILGNGAVAIHDWEFAYQGKTTEDVGKYLSEGRFGLWEEFEIYNNAINNDAGLGYGVAIGKNIREYGLDFEAVSVLGNAYTLEIPVSICPGIGYDINFAHPSCDYGKIGEAAGNDFLKFVSTLERFDKGVYVSIGSAITSPMVFEKGLSMARNVARQSGDRIEDFSVFVNDIQPGNFDWSCGEPPKEDPAYFLRFNKTFSRAGDVSYVEMDNRDFLRGLWERLK
tara:strand:+ start:3144 stop:4070 length:927 start_codon:yes stop_codon:yes gene_type:complete